MFAIIVAVKFSRNGLPFTIKDILKVNSFETWTKLHRLVMQSIYVHFTDYVLGDMFFF